MTVEQTTATSPTLSQTFNSFVQESQARFPALEGRFMIMDVEGNAAYGTRDVRLSRGTPEQLLQYLGTHGITHELRRNPEKSSCAHHDAGGFDIIFFNDTIDPAIAGCATEAAHRRTQRLLDHELAHLAIEDGMYEAKDKGTQKELLGECVADAYALLRDYQRFGTDNPSPDKYVSPFSRADALIFQGDSSHFTTFVLDAIAKCRHALDLDNMTPEQTATIARNFARTYTPSAETVRELKEAFAPVKELWQTDRDAAVRKLIDITLDPKNSEAVFRTGRTWLGTFATSGVRYANGKTPALPPREKNELLQKLLQRDFFVKRQRRRNPQRAAPQHWRALGLNG